MQSQLWRTTLFVAVKSIKYDMVGSWIVSTSDNTGMVNIIHKSYIFKHY